MSRNINRNINRNGKLPSQRQLRVGEKIRNIVADLLLRGECHLNEAEGVAITVSEVQISPDMRKAAIYIMPLGGKEIGGCDIDKILQDLNNNAYQFSRLIAKESTSRNSPRVAFRYDNSFDEAGKINQLLNQLELSENS